MKPKTEIFVLENERRQQLGLGKAWKAAGSSSRIPVACPSLRQRVFYILSHSLSLAPPQPFVLSHSSPPQAHSLPQSPTHTDRFLALHKHCFLFLHPNPSFLGKGAPVVQYLGAGVCSLPQQLDPRAGAGGHLTKEAAWSPSLQNNRE